MKLNDIHFAQVERPVARLVRTLHKPNARVGLAPLALASVLLAGCAALDDPAKPATSGASPQTTTATPTPAETDRRRTQPPTPAPSATPAVAAPAAAVSAAPASQPTAVPPKAEAKPAEGQSWFARLFGGGSKSSDGNTSEANPRDVKSAKPASGKVAAAAPSPQSITNSPPAPPKATPSAVAQVAAAPGVVAPSQNAAAPKEEFAKLFPGTGVFVRPAPVTPVLPQPEELTLNFENQDIRSVVSFILRDVLRETYTIAPGVQGNITLTTARPVPRSSLIPILETVLRQNNAVLVREDNVWKVVPIQLAVRGTTTPQLLPPGQQLRPGYNVILVPLRFAGVKEMQKILIPFAIDATAVQADELRNMLLLSGTQRELKHLLDTVEMFDVDWLQGMSVGVFTLRSADVKTLQPELNQLFGATGPLAGAVRLVPLERLNGFLMITTQPRYLERAKEWLEKLDQLSGTSGGQRLFVYQVQNGKAENLASLLGELFGRGASASSAPALAPGLRPAQLQSGPSANPIPGSITPAPVTSTGATSAAIQGGIGVSKDVRVIADKDNNALLILATAADYEVIESALRKLDIMARQVLIEVTIAEVTLSGALRYGVDWYLSNLNRDGISNPNGRQIATLNTNGGLAVDPSKLPAGAANGFQFIRNVAGGLRAVITAIDTGSNVKVNSNPGVMVADNKQASINVGTSISVNTGTINSGTSGGTTTQSYVNTGTIINVTPRVNAGGLVSLELDAEVSVPGESAVAGGNPPIDQRRLKTTVTVSDGESIILAGLIREDNRRGTAGLPLLSRLPIVGGAFGTQTINTTRSELLISVTPRVVASIEQNRQLVDELRKKFSELGGSIPQSRAAQDTAKPTRSEGIFRSLKLDKIFEDKPQ